MTPSSPRKKLRTPSVSSERSELGMTSSVSNPLDASEPDAERCETEDVSRNAAPLLFTRRMRVSHLLSATSPASLSSPLTNSISSNLRPGGHVGRFCIWTAGAFNALDTVYSSANKKGFNMPRSIMTNADLQRILQADEIKAVLRPRRSATKRATVKKNPLKNIKAMLKLNPYAAVQKRAAQKAIAANTKKQ